MYVLPKQQRIAELARRSPQMGFTSLAYLLDIDWLEAAFHRTRKDGAPGVDGQTWFGYEKDLEANLRSLLDRAKSGTFLHYVLDVWFRQEVQPRLRGRAHLIRYADDCAPEMACTR